jgi:predicted enzyme related to lactoylglutathione lyase
MSEHASWPAGTPSWADNASGDPAAAAEFYSGLFGWEASDQMPPDAPGRYFMCTLRGKSVAACGSQPVEGIPPNWNTYVTVDDADAAAARVTEAGGTVIMEPFDVMDAGRMAACADPAGAAFMVWQPNRHIGAEIANEPGAMAWNELTTRDVDGSTRFYEAVFGWTTSAMEAELPGGGHYLVWQRGEDGVGGMMPMTGEMWPPEMPAHWMVYFAVDDADASAAKADQLGGKVSVPPFDTEVGRIAVLNDPHGAVFSVIALNEAMQEDS